MSKRSQQALREVLGRATLPVVTVREVAAESHLSPVTIGKFIRGAGVTAEQEASIRRALLNLLPSEGKR